MSKRIGWAAILFAVMGSSAAAQTSVTTNGGTTNSVPLFTGSTTIGNSNITQSGSNVGVGTTSPSAGLDVESAPSSATHPGFLVSDGSGIANIGTIPVAQVNQGSSTSNDVLDLVVARPSYTGTFSNWYTNSTASSAFNFLTLRSGASGTMFNIDGKGDVFAQGNVGIGKTPSYPLDVNGMIRSSGGIVFPDGTTQTSAAISGTSVFTTANSSINSINITLNSASIPYINFTRWTGSGSLQDNAFAGMFFNQSDQNYDFGIGTGISTTGNQTATSTVLTVTQTGNVGIGTTTPGSSLEVAGSVTLTQGSGAKMTFQDGSIQSVAWNGVLSGGDYAESVDVTGDRKAYEPGDVLVVDPTSEGRFLKSSKPYSTAVAGVYSTRPGAVGRRQVSDRSHMTEEVPMAMVGIIPTKVCAEGGSIRPGDLLVTSSTPGCAMKGTERTQMLGAVIGKALGHLESGAGVIEVVVTLQ